MDDRQHSLDLYSQYPLAHFQIYKKITNPNYYKATPYNRLPITLKQVVEIFLEFLLLLLKTSIRSNVLAIAAHPGILCNTKIHFYLLDSLPAKGFIIYKQKQCYQQIKKFIQTLSCVKILEGHKQSIQGQHALLIKCLCHYLELAFSQKTIPIHHLNYESLSILNLLTFLSIQQIIVKYSTIFQIKNSILSNRIIEKSVYLRQDIQHKSQDNEATMKQRLINQWTDRIRCIHQFLHDCQERKVIEHLLQKKQLVALQENDSTQNENVKQVIKLCFWINIQQYKTSYQKHKSQCIRQQQSRLQFPNRIQVELVFPSDGMNLIYIITQSNVQTIGKKDFYMIDAYLESLQTEWMKITVSNGARSEIMSTKGIKTYHNQQKQLELRERMKFHSIIYLKQKVVCSIDKQILQQLIIQSYIKDLCQAKKGEETGEFQLNNAALQFKPQGILLLLKKWTTYLQQKLTIFMNNEKQPLLLLK